MDVSNNLKRGSSILWEKNEISISIYKLECGGEGETMLIDKDIDFL